jgi:tRNA (guanine37-N1)-methyltransferase
MRFDILTIFPDMVAAGLQQGVVARAVKTGLVNVNVVNIRDFARGPHKNTDDRPYGGGDGMVMKPEPICRALDSVKQPGARSMVVLLSPQGRRFEQAVAWDLSGYEHLVLICGRYEGIDERVGQGFTDIELSIGDYVLSGGELGALVVMDAVARLIPGVLGGETSSREDSFEDGLLEYPHYTRPEVFRGMAVPQVLLSGDHEKIRLWRRRESLRRTLQRRPDLLQKARLTPEDESVLAELREEGD